MLNLNFMMWVGSMVALAVNFGFAQSDEYELPEDKTKPVITMELTGGYRALPTEPPEPMISIYPDGKVVAGKTNPNIGRAEHKLTRDELQALLKFCIKTNGMLEMTTDSVKKAIKDAGQRLLIADAMSTDITIQIKDKQNTVSVYALSFATRQFGDKVDEVKKVGNVEKELKRIHAITVLGGPKKLDDILKQANEVLQKEDSEAPKLEKSDLMYAQKIKDGSIRLSFSRTEVGKNGVMTANFSVQYRHDKEGRPQFTARAWRR